MIGTNLTKSNPLMNIKQIPHKLWAIEDPIVIVVSLYHHSMELSLDIKVELSISIFGSFYRHLMFEYSETTCMVNKYIFALDQLRWSWSSTRVLDPTWMPQNVVIFRNHLFNKKMILPDLFPFHMILLNSIYFVRPTINLFKLTGSIFESFKLATTL